MATISQLRWLQIGGAPCSGTSALARMLNTSPNVGVFHEYGLLRLVNDIDALVRHELLPKTVLDSSKFRELKQLISIGEHPNGLADIAYDESEQQVVGVVLKKSESAVDPHSRRTLSALEKFYSGRSRAIRKLGYNAYSMAGPKPEHWDVLAQSLYRFVFPEKNLTLIGDKLPLFLDDPSFEELFSRLPLLKCIVILRNPLDAINSSLERRNRTSAGLDDWPIATVEQASWQWILANRRFFRLRDQFPDRVMFVKYEDGYRDTERFCKKLRDFLTLDTPLAPVMKGVPSGLRGFALTPSEKVHVERQFGVMCSQWDELNWTTLGKELSGLPIYLAEGEEIRFSDDTTCGRYVVEGFSETEPYGRWTIGRRASIRFMIPGECAEIFLEMTYSPFPGRAEGTPIALVRVNGLIVTVLKADAFATRAHCASRIHVSPSRSISIIEVELHLLAPKTRDEQPLHDDRDLGIFIESLRWRRAATYQLREESTSEFLETRALG